MKFLVAVLALVSTSAMAYPEKVCKVNASGSKYFVTVVDGEATKVQMPSGETVKHKKLGSFDGFDDEYTMFRAPLGNKRQIIVGIDESKLSLTEYDSEGDVEASGSKSLSSCN